ncbi:Vegetative incompatibility protein HET-E-1 [Pseudocercospora fuligena]|uniref:Vegetative incompatibility protein HET-E-1 n=1 Tax=Pseudocercospora fuligena TaxID=685502 RepID=A0A8H6RIY2_9PEZI|nr:Vegetative incompatibility protein HET-E-1 [Pseudocercospora fuligena]
MAEALAILGGLSSILQIVDFSGNLVKHARELVRSSSDTLKDVSSPERLAVEYETLSSIIICSKEPHNAAQLDRYGVAMAESRHSIVKLAEQCQEQAQDLISEIKSLRMSAAASGWRRLSEGSRKALRFQRKKRVLEKKLQALQSTGSLLQLALQTAADDKTNNIRKSILSSLRYDALNQREQNIETAYAQTYQWALENESLGIRTWLSSDDKIYWVTGKPGSGKSTFMKFLYNEPRTAGLLKRWAKDCPLVVARFYFWYLGTPIQTSTEGLLRSMLYQLISELPELAKVAFPIYFDTSGSPVHPSNHSFEDLLQALRRIAKSAMQLESKKCLCFFTDGLDEFRGDYLALVDLLNELSQRYAIKLLISSRPWTVFSRAYEGVVEHLRLEDLTKSDIHLYVHNNILNALSTVRRLSPHQLSYDHREVLKLIDDIVEKAEGVFLWIFLVVQDVRRGIAEDDAISMLRHRVQAFPPDLNKFFKELIYDRVDRAYAQQTSQALLLAMLCAEEKPNTKLADTICFLDYWLIVRSPTGFADSQFPFEWDPLPEEMSPPQISRCADETRRFLSSACKDLLVLDQNSSVDLRRRAQVIFLHRTVYDFLRTQEISQLLLARAPACVKSGWILHLLAWSKLKLLHFTETGLFQSGVRITGHVPILDAALSDLHPDMSLAFVDDLATYIKEHNCIVSNRLSSQAVHTLAAYRINGLVRQYVQSHGGQVHDCVNGASLGMSLEIKFRPKHIDLDLLELALAKGVQNLHVFWDREKYPAKCCHTTWQFLLQRLYFKTLPTSQDNVNEDDDVGFLWKAARLYLRAGANVSEVFCTTDLDPTTEHIHVWKEASDFLEKTMPPEYHEPTHSAITHRPP